MDTPDRDQPFVCGFLIEDTHLNILKELINTKQGRYGVVLFKFAELAPITCRLRSYLELSCLMRNLWLNFDQEDGLDFVLEVPIPDEMLKKMGDKAIQR
ncbi:hypothetical protein Sjap_013382 [Stephania japonica]|uniref:Uncharacterized protein n=1 Tax=Stephania japonica TaxID=461633 RepID=A0AAP0IZ00_9MAGN